jgi:hypothetical protein
MPGAAAPGMHPPFFLGWGGLAMKENKKDRYIEKPARRNMHS